MFARGKSNVADEIHAGHFVSADQGELRHATVALDGFKECLVERQNFLLLRRGLLPVVGHLAERIHHGGRIQFFRTALSAGQAAGATPEGRAPEEFLLGRRIADLNQPHDLVRHQIHVPGHGAAGGALAALVTLCDVHTGGLENGPTQSRRLCSFRGILFQRTSPH